MIYEGLNNEGKAFLRTRLKKVLYKNGTAFQQASFAAYAKFNIKRNRPWVIIDGKYTKNKAACTIEFKTTHLKEADSETPKFSKMF